MNSTTPKILTALMLSALSLGASQAPYRDTIEREEANDQLSDLEQRDNAFRSHPHYDTDPEGHWDDYGHFWTPSSELKQEQRQQQKNQESHDARRKIDLRKTTLHELDQLTTYIDRTKDWAMDPKDNKTFVDHVYKQLVIIEGTLDRAKAPKNVIREANEAKEHINAVKRGNKKLQTKEQREQFYNRTKKFVADLTNLVQAIE